MEIFRFVSLRPPQLASSASVVERGVRVYERPSDLLGELAELRNEENARARMTARAESRLSEPVPDDDQEVLDVLARVDDWLVGRHSPVSAQELRRFVETSSGVTPRELVERDAFHSATADLADRLLAALVVAPSGQGSQLDTLVRRIRTRAAIQLLAADDEATDAAVHERLRAVVYLPRGVLPVPAAESEPDDTGEDDSGESDTEDAGDIEVELRRTRHARDLVAELVQWQPLLNETAKKEPSAKARRPVTAPFVLTSAALDRLDDDAAAVLAEQALDPATMSAPSIVASLERRIRTLAKQHPSPVARRPISVIGTHAAPADEFFAEGGSGGGSGNRRPGPCQGGQSVVQEPTTTTVPTSIGVVRVAGVGDLLKVEQTTRRYEMGEIAHIENVLASERRVRTHRRSDTTEETFLTQVETTDESERDLVSTDRFELQKEAAAVIATDASKDVGITINASYGPTVDATLNSNFATSTSTENSSRTSTAFARETTDRSVARLTRRTLETRTRRTLTEIIETNKHGFRNDDPQATNISGVYRWVDKVYESNVVRYGRRLFVECVIPEPAAFIRYADARRASQLPDIQRPDPPGYCVDGRFEPLTAEDLDEETYLDWAAAYELADLAPPPSALKVIGLPIEYKKDEAGPTTKITTELMIPVGYLGVSASVSDLVDLESGLGGGQVVFNPFIAIGGSVIRPLPGDAQEPAVPLYNIEGALPISVWVLAAGLSYCFNVMVCCARAPETMQKWQIDTYTSIMSAYHTMLAEYNERLSALDIGAMQIRGRNPLLAREIERTELKRLSIEMMTDQHFEAFDSTGTDALGYPSPDVADADREGRYIQFFEQMFEWTNMTYVFYPYFWSRKAQWPALALLDDTDPLFARFLQAGAARVQIPVRPGYESALAYFIESGGVIWEGGDPPHIEDPAYVSLIDEIRATEGVGNASVGPGLISATAGSATATGAGTQFEQSDVGRRIDIGTDRFVIREVVSAVEVSLSPVPGTTVTDVEYSLGGWYVGPPWEVRLPTSLVALQGDSTLPTWPSNRP